MLAAAVSSFLASAAGRSSRASTSSSCTTVDTLPAASAAVQAADAASTSTISTVCASPAAAASSDARRHDAAAAASTPAHKTRSPSLSSYSTISTVPAADAAPAASATGTPSSSSLSDSASAPTSPSFSPSRSCSVPMDLDVEHLSISDAVSPAASVVDVASSLGADVEPMDLDDDTWFDAKETLDDDEESSEGFDPMDVSDSEDEAPRSLAIHPSRAADAASVASAAEIESVVSLTASADNVSTASAGAVKKTKREEALEQEVRRLWEELAVSNARIERLEKTVEDLQEAHQERHDRLAVDLAAVVEEKERVEDHCAAAVAAARGLRETISGMKTAVWLWGRERVEKRRREEEEEVEERPKKRGRVGGDEEEGVVVVVGGERGVVGGRGGVAGLVEFFEGLAVRERAGGVVGGGVGRVLDGGAVVWKRRGGGTRLRGRFGRWVRAEGR